MTERLYTVFINKKKGKVLIVAKDGSTKILSLERWKALYASTKNKTT